MANPVQHTDFGEKIGGARKDLWQKRGLFSSDLAAMNSREADKYVKKDYIWKKPDYQAMIDGGLPVDAAFFIKTVRDSLPAAPVYVRGDESPENRLARQEQYIDTVREIEAAASGVKTKADALGFFARCMEGGGYFERMTPGAGSSYYATVTAKGRENPVITNKLAQAVFFRSERDYERKVTLTAQQKQFGIPKEDKIPAGYEIRFHDGKHSYSKNNDWKVDTYFVAKNHRILQANFETREAALKWVQDYARQRGANGKVRFVPPQLGHVKREGPDYRRGRNVDGADYISAFGFKGGEYGNWMSQADRQASLNMGYDALKDLAGALQISDRDISYQGALSIAFGARGSGNAVAHYEPTRQVINLTKMRGAGSLAHEWWHGFDDFMGGKLGAGGMLSEKPFKHPLFAKLIETIKYKPETLEQAAERTGKINAQTIRSAESWLKYSVLPAVNRAESKDAAALYEKLKDKFLRGEPGSVDLLNGFKKELTGRVIPKEDRDRLHTYERILHGIAENREPLPGKASTDYFLASKEMAKVCEKDGGYWESNTELTARAFATYIMDRLPGRSDYLAGHAECAVGMTADKDGELRIIRAFPQGEERAAINAVFDEIVAELKRENYLTHDEHIKPEPPPEKQTPAPDVSRKPQDFRPDAPGDQLSFASLGRSDKAAAKPSVMDKLAAAKEAVAKNDAGRADRAKDKKRGAEI